MHTGYLIEIGEGPEYVKELVGAGGMKAVTTFSAAGARLFKTHYEAEEAIRKYALPHATVVEHGFE